MFIQRSNQRIDAFKACLENPKHLGLIRDNDTRWNSWYNVLVRVLDLRTAINWACWKYNLTDDQLTEEEWAQLNSLLGSLKALSDCTQASEGRFATLEKVLPTMEFLLEFLQPLPDENENHDPFLRRCAFAGWEKLRKYYNATERAPAFVGAIVMCHNISGSTSKTLIGSMNGYRLPRKRLRGYGIRNLTF